MIEVMKTFPDISVVIPCFNSEAWVGRAICSVLAQERVSVEVIVMDDGSTDRSLDVIRSFGDRIQWGSGRNKGACTARNLGLSLANADYVMFLDADDYIEGAFLASAVEALKAGNSDVAFGRIQTEVDGHRTAFHPYATESPAETMRGFLEKGFVPPCGTVWSTIFVRSIGGWKEGLRRYQDYEMTFRALSAEPRIAFFTGGYGIYFQHKTGGRISLKSDFETVKDQARTIRFVGECVASSELPEHEKYRLMQERAYRFWQQTCRSGEMDSIKVGRALYVEFGGTGHIGSFTHKVVASVLGLRAKEWISLRISKMKRRNALLSVFDQK